jgi:hypothetical protein
MEMVVGRRLPLRPPELNLPTRPLKRRRPLLRKRLQLQVIQLRLLRHRKKPMDKEFLKSELKRLTAELKSIQVKIR